MIYRALYQLALPIGALFYLPKILKKKRIDPPQKKKEVLIWIHAVSMGETGAVAPLAQKLKEQYGDQAQFIVSSQTKTGHAHAKKVIPFADDHIFLPLDLWWIVKQYVEAARPDLVILSETDLWPNFLHYCKKQGAKLYLVNAKMSPSSFNLYQKFPGVVRMTYGLFDGIFPQSVHYEDRFRSLGLNYLQTCGNLKLDFPVKPFKKRGFGLKEKDLVLCIGSTHHPEERWLLEIIQKFKEIKILLAPRHPERVGEVEAILKELHLSYALSTEGGIGENRVLLVNQMGILKECYASSDIAIVGGSFIERVGGHNIVEPCEYGVPVLYGPYIWSQPELDELVKQFGAGEQVTLENLSEVLQKLIRHQEHRASLGEKGKKLVEANRGSTERTLAAIKTLALKKGAVV